MRPVCLLHQVSILAHEQSHVRGTSYPVIEHLHLLSLVCHAQKQLLLLTLLQLVAAASASLQAARCQLCLEFSHIVH